MRYIDNPSSANILPGDCIVATPTQRAALSIGPEDAGKVIVEKSTGRMYLATMTEGAKPLSNNLAAELAEIGFLPTRRQNAALLLDRMDVLTGWSTASGASAGTNTVASGAGPFGEDVISLTMTADGARKIEKDIAIPAASLINGFFAMWIKSPDWSKITSTARFMFVGGLTKYYQQFGMPWYADIVQWTYGGEDRLNGEWRLYFWHGTQMAASGGASAFLSNTDDLYRLRIGIQSGLAGAEMQIGPIYYGVKAKTQVRWSFDDSNKTDITKAYPILRQFGYVATSFQIAASIGQAFKLTLADLQTLKAAGWTIGVHGGFSHIDTMQNNYQAILSDVLSNRNFLLSNGFAAKDYAYPEGDYGQSSIDALRAAGITNAWSISGQQIPIIDGVNPLAKSRIGTSEKTLQNLKDILDTAIAYGGDVNFYSHQVADGATGIHTDIAIFQGIVEYVAQKQAAGLCDVVM